MNQAFLPYPPVVQRVLHNRGIRHQDELELRLARLLPASQLAGLDQAIALLQQALIQQQTILIAGDFDCDGATSTALMVLVLRQLGAKVNYIVPDRFRFGYGLTPALIEHAAQQFDFDLIITVDNGISSREGVAFAHALGKKVLITDHHLTSRDLPAADAIINPNQPDCPFASKALVGVGVAFYLLAAWMTYRQQRQEATVRLTPYLDLVALGTVADVGVLDQNNRILVQAGLERIRRGQCRPGILALLEAAQRRPESLRADDLGFILGPRINAAGRMENMQTGIECLLADEMTVARDYALQLNQLNMERRRVEQAMQQQALDLLGQLELIREGEPLPPALVLFQPQWHQGVIGIVAGRLKERFYRPSIVLAPAGDGSDLVKGSARSVPGIHIRDAIERVADQHPELITHFGGHAMAAGLSLPQAHVEQFAAAFTAEMNKLDPALLTPLVQTDGELAPDELSLHTVAVLAEIGPYGNGFPQPCFEGVFEVLEQKLLKEQHLKLKLRHPDGGEWLDGICFGVDRQRWPDLTVEQVRLVYRLSANHFNGQTRLQLDIQSLEAVA